MKPLFRARLLVTLVASALFPSGSHGQVLLTEQLLVNPGAETGSLVGWSESGAVGHIADDGSYEEGFATGFDPHTGNYQFVAGANPGGAGTLFQNVSLTLLAPSRLALIDAGLVFANISAWEQRLAQGTPDYARIRLNFSDGTGASLGSFVSPTLDYLGWHQYTAATTVPSGTRSIRYSIDSYLGMNGGTWIDAFTDEHSLVLTSTVPEPVEWSALAGIALLAVGGWRSVFKSRQIPS